MDLCIHVVDKEVEGNGNQCHAPTPPRRRKGVRHGTGTPLPEFLTLVGPFQ